jgi:ribosomal protein S18 acetylase RimI-like enzyme
MADVDRVVEMLNARSQAFCGRNQSTPADVRAWWTWPRMNLETDMRLVFADDEVVGGIAAVYNDGEPYADLPCSATVHPRHEACAELWDWLHSWALRRVTELAALASPDIRVAASTRTFSGDQARCEAVERAGFQLVRVGNDMGIDLVAQPPEAQWPAGISVRTANVEQDLEAIVAHYLETWRDHWGFVEQPFNQVLADWRERVKALGDKLDPTLWFLAVDGPEIVGVSLCNNQIADDTTRGYVDALGVRPAWRKRGVALALLHHTFAEFHRRGYAAVELDMDSQNLTGALRVYERAGMHVIRQSMSYEKELRPGIDLATRELAA